MRRKSVTVRPSDRPTDLIVRRIRFPADFMFRLTREEAENLKSQSVTSSPEHGGHRYVPYVFTEQGVAMLSSVLRSPARWR